MFSNAPTIEIHRIPKLCRRYLLLIRAGSNARPSFFYSFPSSDRNYDLAVNYYSDPHVNDVLKDKAEIMFSGGLSKMQGAKLFFEETGLHLSYDGVFFLDDDVELMFEPDGFFDTCRDNKLDLAQPSVSHDSAVSLDITRHHPGLFLRTTNWVEIMAPFLGREFLAEMMHSFSFSVSGWGLDVYWGHHLGDRWTAGIVDGCQMRHLKPVDLENGAFYLYLKSIGVVASDEMREIFRKIGITEYIVKPIKFVYYSYRIV